MCKFMSVSEIQFLIGRHPMRNYSPGALPPLPYGSWRLCFNVFPTSSVIRKTHSLQMFIKLIFIIYSSENRAQLTFYMWLMLLLSSSSSASCIISCCCRFCSVTLFSLAQRSITWRMWCGIGSDACSTVITSISELLYDTNTSPVVRSAITATAELLVPSSTRVRK